MGQPQSKGSSDDSTLSSLPEFELIKEVNHPNYGQVQIFNETRSQSQVLLKELTFNKKQHFEEKLKTIKAGNSFKHPNVIQLLKYNVIDASSSTPGISIYLENATKDLQTELKDRIRSRIYYTENELLLIAENISSALYNLQIKGIAHGDVRPSNIFISGQKYKITNPLAEINEHSSALARAILYNEKTFLSPQLLMNVPEQIVHHNEDEFKADVFALGATLLGIATLTSSEDLFDYHSGSIEEMYLTERLHNVSDRYSNFTYELISSMLNLGDRARPEWTDIQEILQPYQDEIRHKADLPFAESRHFVIRDEDFLEGRSGATAHEEKHKRELLPHGEHDEHSLEGTRMQSEVTIQKIDEQLAASRQLRENQPFIKEEGFDSLISSRISVENKTLDMRIKSALEKSHDTYKQVYGNENLSTYENDLKSSGFIISQESDKWHKKDLSDYKELLGLSPGYSDIMKLSTNLIKTHNLGGEESKEHARKPSGPPEGLPSYDTSYISARAQIPESNVSYTTNYGLSTDILKTHDNEKILKSGFADIHNKPSGSISYHDTIIKHTSPEHVPTGHIDIHKSSYIPASTTSYTVTSNIGLGLKDIQPSQSTYIGGTSHRSWQNEIKSPPSANADIEDIIRKYTSQDPVLATSTVYDSQYRSPDQGITRLSTHYEVEKKTIPLSHDFHSGYDSIGKKSEFIEHVKEFTPKYSVAHDFEHTHKTSPTFDAALYSSAYRDKVESDLKTSSYVKASPSAYPTADVKDYTITGQKSPSQTYINAYHASPYAETRGAHHDHYSSPAKSTGSRDQTRIEDIVAAHIQKTPTSSDRKSEDRKGLIEEAGSAISKYGFTSEDGSHTHHHYESPNRYY